MLNKLLKSQISKFYPDLKQIPEKHLALLKVISETYYEKERDSAKLEQLLQKSSNELAEVMLVDTRNIDALINSTSDIMWSVDRNCKLIKGNKSFISVIEIMTGNILNAGDDLLCIPGFPDENLKRWELYYNRAFAGETFTVEEYNDDFGRETWTSISLQPILEGTDVVGAACFSSDITESKISSAIIKQSEEMMAEAQRIAHFGSWEMSLVESENNPLNTLKWSDEMYRIFGYEPGQCEPNVINFFATVHPDDREAVTSAFERSLSDSSKYCIEHRIILPSGEIRWVRENAHINVNEKTLLPQKMIGTIEDITDRKKAEQAQKKAEANLRDILENTDTAYVLMDTDATVLSFNQLAKDLSKLYSGTEIREGVNYVDIMLEYRKAEVRAMIDNVIALKDKMSYETVYFTNEKKEQWLFVSITPILNDDNELFGLSIAARNITERKLFEIERSKITNYLTQRNKDLEQFTNIVSHNLRAPVASILGLSIVLDSSEITEETRKECMKGFVSSVKNLDNTIIDLNYILQARKEIGDKKEIVDFAFLVKSIKESIGDVVTNSGTIIETDFSSVSEMYTLKSYLNSIFYNLISNSIKYRKTHEAPLIRISTKRVNRKIIMVFSDNGIGIDMKEHSENLFGLYKRFHPNIEGKGMGLYMVKTQVETLGGRVNINSKINIGTEITLEFET